MEVYSVPNAYSIKYNISREFLVEQFLDKHRTIKEIAEQIGCSIGTINNYLKKYKIKKTVSLVGKRFGKLVVNSQAPSKRGERYWECLCDCGKVKIFRTKSLLKVQSCGCLVFENRKKRSTWKGYEGIHGKFWYNIKRGALARGHQFNITLQFAWELYLKQNRKCALTGLPLVFADTVRDFEKGQTTASLDRIDSAIGYSEDNVQWVHKDVNLMKQGFTQDYFCKLCKMVSKYVS